MKKTVFDFWMSITRKDGNKLGMKKRGCRIVRAGIKKQQSCDYRHNLIILDDILACNNN